MLQPIGRFVHLTGKLTYKMLKNFFIVAIRNILKQKFYAFINVLGLGLGVAVSIFILIYVLDEIGFDRFHATSDRLYRVNLNASLAGQELSGTYTPPPMAAALRDEIPEIEHSMRMWEWNNTVVKYEDKVFTEDKLYHADSSFFDIFSFDLLQGDPATALDEPNSVLLSEALAQKYFEQQAALGKIITIGNDKQAFKVTGVLENPPSNSHLQYNLVTSFHSFDFSRSEIWLNNSLQTYFTVVPNANLENVQAQLDHFIIKYIGPEIQQFMGVDLEQFKEQNGKYGFNFIPVKDIHLKSFYQGEYEPVSDIKYIYILGAIGIFIIIIAAINFMNLSTARSSGRAKEVGMRKTFGAVRQQLISQFMLESFIYTVVAVILAILIVVLLLPQFNLLSGKSIDYLSLLNIEIIAGVILITLIVSLLAGSYPALYLTSFNIATVTKGKIATGMKSGSIRGTLVVVQFTISIILLICTAIVYQQLQFTQNKNLGFNKENVIVIYNASRVGDNRQALKNSLLTMNDIVTASYANHVIPGTNNTTVFRRPGVEKDHLISTYWADYEHLTAMGFTMKEGRYFSRDFASDSNAVVINEATAREMGWEQPVNEEMWSFNEETPKMLNVIGVLKDFNFESLRDNIRPLILRLTPQSRNLIVRFKSENPQKAIALIEAEWKKFAPNEPFDFEFLDQKFDALYRAEQRMGSLFTTFTIMAIVIACLGLLGLSAYTAEQKTKEIGIRKSLGASELNIITLLNREFSKFVLIAFVIALLPSYFFVNQWLEGFAYRVNINFVVFLLSGVITFLVALITVSYQAFKASKLNPTESLRYE